MKNTNTTEFHQKAFTYLANALYDVPEDLDQHGRALRLKEKFDQEYNYLENRRRTPNTQMRVSEWLFGLPINIAYTYHDILALASDWHGCEIPESKRDRICESWFVFMAFKLMQFWESEGINPHEAPK